jgi:ribonuclease HI
MKQAVQLGIKSLIVNGDSLLVIRQMKGEFKVSSENLRELYKTAKILEKSLNVISYNHVYRKDNKRADALSNEGLVKTKEAIIL